MKHLAAHTFALALALALVALLATGLAQATPNVPPPAQSRPLLIGNATLHTVSGPVIQQGRMLLEAGRIKAIGGAELAAPADALFIDLKGHHVYPGLVAANTALGLVEIQAVRATIDTAEAGAVNPNARALVAINADSELIPVTRAGGVLAALSVPRIHGAGLIAGTSALVQLDGWNWQDMALKDEVGLHITLPSLRFNPALFPPGQEERLAEMKRSAQARLKLLDEVFESAQAYAAARAADPKLPLDTRWEALLPVLRGERAVFIAAAELAQIRHALDFAQRFKLRLVIVGGDDAPLIADQLRARDVPVIIAALHRLPQRRDADVDAIYRLPAQLAAAGVRFCIARGGGEFDVANDRNLAIEAGNAVAYGLSADEALKAVTLYPAQLLGADQLLGSLDAGKLASFFVTDGDVLDIRSQVERIFIQGREIELKDRQTQLRDKYEQRLRR